MSTIVVPDQAKIANLQLMTAASGSGVADGVRLFKSDITLDASTLIADLDAVEADFTGYARQLWQYVSAPIITDGVARATWAAATFTQSGIAVNNTIYGYYLKWVYLGATGWWAQKLDTPFVFDAAGKQLVIVPRLDLGQI